MPRINNPASKSEHILEEYSPEHKAQKAKTQEANSSKKNLDNTQYCIVKIPDVKNLNLTNTRLLIFQKLEPDFFMLKKKGSVYITNELKLGAKALREKNQMNNLTQYLTNLNEKRNCKLINLTPI